MKYRSRTEILGQILASIGKGSCTKTKIMYKAYLSHAQMKEYTKFLEEKDLVHYEEGEQQYRITEKGMQYMQKYNEMLEVVSEDNHYVDDEYALRPKVFI